MKYLGEDHILFEDDKTLDELANYYFVIRDMFKRKIIKKPMHDTNLVEAFKKLYKVELDVDEMTELRTFMEEEYPDWKRAYIADEVRNAEIVNLKDITGE